MTTVRVVSNNSRYGQDVSDLTGEQRERLREISDRCPVQKLLTNPISIQTQLVDSAEV